MTATAWLVGCVAGSALIVLKRTRLWPQDIWYSVADDTTMIMITPMLEPGDVVGVIDVLYDDANDRVYSALVISSEGVGCVLTDSEYFKVL